jgi:hypothetical protein
VKLSNGEKSRLTSLKIQMLESIGFEWALSGQELWEKRFRELLAYKTEVRYLGYAKYHPLCIDFIILFLIVHNIGVHRKDTATFLPDQKIMRVG